MDEHSVGWAFFFGLCIGLVMAALVGNTVADYMRAEAVRHDAACWAGDENGDHEFRWLCKEDD